MPKRAVSISSRRQRGSATMVTVVVDDNKYLTLSGCNSQRLNHSQTFKPPATATTAIHKHPHLLHSDTSNRLPQKATTLEDGRINYSARAPPGGHHNSRHVVNMLIAVVVAFFICWAPFHAQRLFAMYAGDKHQDPVYSAVFKYITYVSGILYFMSTCINPLLYNIMSNKFREAFKETIARSCYRKSHTSNGGPHSSYLPPGRLSLARSLSQRSCNSNSHSTANTCSSSVCSIQPLAINVPQPMPQQHHHLHQHPQMQLQLQTPYQCSAAVSCSARYTTTDNCSDLNGLKSSRRPLVVSFRRHLPKTTSSFELGADKVKLDKYPSELHRIAEQTGAGSGEVCASGDLRSPDMYASDRTIDRKRRCVSPIMVQTASSSSQQVYKSPYESPEMTANCKELEHNLQKILEDLVLYRHPLSNKHNDKVQ